MTLKSVTVCLSLIVVSMALIACTETTPSAPPPPQQAAPPAPVASAPAVQPSPSAAPETAPAEKPPAAAEANPPAAPASAVTAPAPASAVSAVYGEKKSSSSDKPAKQAASVQGDRTALSWYYMKKKKGEVPNFPPETKKYTEDQKALWVGKGKKVYITFDTGGPMGDTDLLLKTLKDNDAKVNFFIAGYNMKKYPDFIRRLVDDGHLVANHTMTHTDMNLQTDDQVKQEINDFAKLFKETTGKDVPPYFRFPYGRYNMHLLSLVSDMGYTSVFWSTAMVDWLPRKNGAEDPLNDILNNLHDGNIILMHQGSPENIEALDRIIKEVRKAGYEFGLLDEIS